MADNLSNTAKNWVDVIDIHSDGVADTTSPEVALKDSLKKDLQELWTRKTEWRITEAEYNRYSNVAKMIFEDRNMSAKMIRTRYMTERNKTLKDSNTLLEDLFLKASNGVKSVRNIGTDGLVALQQKIISEDSIQAYNDEEWNHLINIKKFEEQLKTWSIDEINGLALKNYFIYLKSKGLLNNTILEQKCGSPGRLLYLSILWQEMEKEEHVRNAVFKKNAGFTKKFDTFLRSGTVGGVENTAQNIFKGVIYENIKKIGIERELLTEKNYKGKTDGQLDKDLEGMKYDRVVKEITDELNKEFHGKAVTSTMIESFFERKRREKEERNKKLETEQKEMTRNMTVWQMFVWFPISGLSSIGDIKDKKMSALTADEKRKSIEEIKKSGREIPLSLQMYISKQEEINKNNQGIKAIGHTNNWQTREAVAASINHGGSPKALENIVSWSIKVGEKKDAMNSKEELYKKTLEQIGYVNTSISSIYADKKVLKEVLLCLENKSLTETELYADLKNYLWLAEQNTDNYVMATQNLTEEQLVRLKRNGFYADSFAEDLYKEDVKKKKTTDFIIREQTLDNKGDLSSEGLSLGSAWFRHAVESLEQGQWFTALSFGSEKIRVVRNGQGFDIETQSKIEHCQKPEEVTNYIESRKFIHDIGCDFMMGDMDEILETIRKRNPKIAKTFDMKQGLTSEQEIVIMKTMIRVLDLPIVFEWVAKVELKQRFREYFTHTADSSLQKETRKWWFFSVNGGFLSEIFKNKILAFS